MIYTQPNLLLKFNWTPKQF